MPSTLDLRRRIKSVKNTAQITKAMQMVAAAKMRKAQAAALAGRPYQEMLTRVLARNQRPRRTDEPSPSGGPSGEERVDLDLFDRQRVVRPFEHQPVQRTHR